MAMSLPFLYRSDAKLDFLQVPCYQKKTSEGKEGMMGSGSALLFVHTVYYLTTLWRSDSNYLKEYETGTKA